MGQKILIELPIRPSSLTLVLPATLCTTKEDVGGLRKEVPPAFKKQGGEGLGWVGLGGRTLGQWLRLALVPTFLSLSP